MGIWNKLTNEFIDIIEWLDSTNDTMVWRFPRYQSEIKNGAKLIVRESQTAVFVNEGQIADVFRPGTHTLTTQNLPLLTTLKGWKYGFNSPFKADVYFVNTKQFTNQKWGTKNPLMLRDPEFGPVRLRAFGTYAIRISEDPAKFLKEVVGTDGDFNTDEINEHLRNIVVSRFADLLGESKIPVLDLVSNYDELSRFITQRIGDDFDGYGLKVTKMLVENISLPPEVETALDKRSSMGIIGNLNAYTQFQAANSLEKGGTGSDAFGAGLGFSIANQMANNMQQPANTQPVNQTPAGNAPPPLPPSLAYFVAVNNQQQGPFDASVLRQMADQGTLTRDTLVWKSGMSNWERAGEVSEIKALLGTVPPPLPG
jgi:membrane protease subunit (stomatin/prohibitin family)